MEAGLGEQRTNSVLYVKRGWATGAAVCPFRLSVAAGLLWCCRNPVFEWLTYVWLGS